MKNVSLKIIALCFTLFVASCASDDGSVFDTGNQGNTDDQTGGETEEPQVAALVFSEANPGDDISVAAAVGEVGTKIEGRVIYTSTDLNQRRMYITQNINGAGDMPFNEFDLDDATLRDELKADGSIDLDKSNKKDIDFTFDLPAPAGADDYIVYTFWTTTGKGDFRDHTKRLALGAGQIIVTVGNGVAVTNGAVRSFEGVRLFAPALDGSTQTFFSFLNETVYRINVGPEFRNFWDFGYYYGASGVSENDNASFASAFAYDDAFGFFVDGLKPGEDEEDMEAETLNEGFFAKSTSFDADGFDAVTMSADLNTIAASTDQKVTNLAVGDIIEFIDNYGKAGLIKIIGLQAGFNTDDYIEFDVKIQP